MEQFLNVNLGNLITILAFLVGGIVFANTIKIRVQNLTDSFKGIQQEVSELKAVVITIARQEERMTAMDQRMLLQGQRVDGVADKVNHMLLVSYDKKENK